MFVVTMTCNGTIARIATARRDVSTIYKKASALCAKARASSSGASVQVQVAAATVEGINRAGCIAGGIEREMRKIVSGAAAAAAASISLHVNAQVSCEFTHKIY